jgi:hypothetical protein
VLLDLAQTMENIHPRQDQFAGKAEAVRLLLDQNGSSLSTLTGKISDRWLFGERSRLQRTGAGLC